MRFYHHRTSQIVELSRPAFRLFLFGPFYLAWLRLWRDAAVLAVLIYVLVHGSIIITGLLVGEAAQGGVAAVWMSFDAFMHAYGSGEASLDDAFAALIAASLPYYVALAVLLFPATLSAVYARRYFLHRYRSLGYVPLQTDEVEAEAELFG